MASGIKNMMMALAYKIRKYLVVNRKADGAVAIGSSSFFAVPLPSLCRIFTNLWAKFSPQSLFSGSGTCRIIGYKLDFIRIFGKTVI